jgi:hypothetical protein
MAVPAAVVAAGVIRSRAPRPWLVVLAGCLAAVLAVLAVGMFGALGEVCRGARIGRCAQLVRELARVDGAMRSTELIYCWDPDGPTDPRGFARADHCDHIHVGWYA